jgi:hypothetical protein
MIVNMKLTMPTPVLERNAASFASPAFSKTLGAK